MVLFLNDSELQKEIDLLEYQKSELKALASDLSEADKSRFDEWLQTKVDHQKKGRDGLTHDEILRELNSRVENWPIEKSNIIF